MWLSRAAETGREPGECLYKNGRSFGAGEGRGLQNYQGLPRSSDFNNNELNELNYTHDVDEYISSMSAS